MEPNENITNNNESVPQEVAYHTISGTPETLNEIQNATILKEQVVVSQAETISQQPIILETATQSMVQESFFDRHITAIVFWGNLLCGPLVSYLSAYLVSTSGLKLSPALYPLYSLGSSLFIITIILGAFNFRGKRKEIFRGIGYLFTLIFVIALVGLGACLLILSGI